MSTFHYDPPQEPFLDILFEDEQIMVVNKPSGILSVPGKAVEHFDSIASRVKSLYPSGGAVHRLDMGTSGIMVVAKTPEATSALGRQFQDRVSRSTMNMAAEPSPTTSASGWKRIAA